MITLQPKSSNEQAVTKLGIPDEAKKENPAQLKGKEAVPLVEESIRALEKRMQSASANAISLFLQQVNCHLAAPLIAD